MPKILIAGLALFGLMALAAAFAHNSGRAEPALTRADSVLPPPSAHLFYLNTAHARRFIRWDCSDWQPRPAVADADNELASSILETLAANRGKTLYCALDQSDTWTKRQVYDNAHMHNDRDRTQYDGSQGQGRFRGFTAGQEGWLTDGEHGITGVSPERIFEFPQEERRRRRWKTIVTDSEDVAAGEGDNNPVLSVWGQYGIGATSQENGYLQAESRLTTLSTRPEGINLPRDARNAARVHCRAEGFDRAHKVRLEPLTYVYSANSPIAGDPLATHRYRARESREWTAVCQKTKRVRR